MPDLPTIEVTDEQLERIEAAVKSQYGLGSEDSADDALVAIMINAVNSTVNAVEAQQLRDEAQTELQAKLVDLHNGLPEAPEVARPGLELPPPPGPVIQAQAANRAEDLIAELHTAVHGE